MLLLRFLGGGEYGTNPGSIDRHGFFGEDMFAGIDRCFDVRGAKTGWRSENDDVHAAVDDLLISVETVKAFRGFNLHFLLSILSETGEGALDLLFEGIAHGSQRDIFVRREGLSSRAGAASAATDQTDAQGFTGRLGEGGTARDKR